MRQPQLPAFLITEQYAKFTVYVTQFRHFYLESEQSNDKFEKTAGSFSSTINPLVAVHDDVRKDRVDDAF